MLRLPRMLLRARACRFACMQVEATHTHFASRAPEGNASTCVRFLRLLMLQHEALLQHTSETGETFITYAYNIRLKQMKHFE
jgi:hypothetical protein